MSRITFPGQQHGFFWGLQLGALLLVLGSVVLQFLTVAIGTVLLALFLSGALLFWLYRRYQASPLLKEKRDLQIRAIQLQAQLAEEEQRLKETRERREHLLRVEQFRIGTTLFNLQRHHIEKGLATHMIKDAVIPGLEPKSKERLTESGIHTALDITEQVVSQLVGFDHAKRVFLMNWRSKVYARLNATMPVKLPDYQQEDIKKKFQRLHAANDEIEKTADGYHQQFKAALHANEERFNQLASLTFWGYLIHAMKPT